MQRLDSLFDIRYGHSLELNTLTQVAAPEGVNFVSRTSTNNGVAARVITSETPAPAGEITVALSGNPLAAFVQPEAFVCAFHVAILTPKVADMPLVEKLWWCYVISMNKYRYSYGRQANRTLGSIMIPDTVPEWVYSANVISVERLAKSLKTPVPLSEPTSWGVFMLGDLFDISKGRRLTKADRLYGNTRFIGASEKNNGITDLADVEPLYKGGVLTVSYNGSVGQAFYQNEPFWPSDDINVLTPKLPMSMWGQLFIASIIRHERTRYTYGYKWTLERMVATEIRLPTREDGTVDLDYMERFMMGLPFSASIT